MFVLIGGMYAGRKSPDSMYYDALAGLFVGAILATDLKPGAFRYPTVWRVSFGTLGGVALAASLETSPVALLAGATIGGVVGFLARYWMNTDAPYDVGW